MSGPLGSLRIVEVGGIGPSPFACMVLSDLGADIIRIDRPLGDSPVPPREILNRGRPSVGIDLKSPAGVDAVLALVESADAIVEGYRPGVMERLGLGPDVCLARNPRIVFGRMTGWGQEGPYARNAGHDINYIALAGALEMIGRVGQPPTPPLNLIGDFGGGAMFLAVGVLAGVIEARLSGLGQVVDVAMVDGTALLMSPFRAYLNDGRWSTVRGTNLLDSGAHMYDVYECLDGRCVSIGALEPQFYEELRKRAGLESDPSFDDFLDPSRWPELKTKMRALFLSKTREQWCQLLEHSDTCFAPVLSLDESAEHPHIRGRSTFVEVFGELQAAPAPRFSRTPGAIRRPPSTPGSDTESALSAWGISREKIEAVLDASGNRDRPAG